jgi:hypothetical protein
MDEMLGKLLDNEAFAEETKKNIAIAFRSSLEEAKVEQEKSLREEFARRYDNDKEKIAEAVQQYVDQKNEAEMVEFHAEMKALSEQRMKYVNAQTMLKEHARVAIGKRLQIFEKAIQRVLIKETRELHEDLKVNRAAAVRAITEAKSQSAADRQTFRTKGAKVLEHILRVQFDSKLRAMKEDIDKAKQNDFGSRIFEAFMGEARRLFFNSHKELRSLMKTINEQQTAHEAEKAQLIGQITEAQTIARKTYHENKQIKEAAIRSIKTSKLLATVPAGQAREKMKNLLESTSVDRLDQTFRRYASEILTESPVQPRARPQLQEHAAGNEWSVRRGNGRGAVVEDEDDEEIFQLRQLAGIVRK